MSKNDVVGKCLPIVWRYRSRFFPSVIVIVVDVAAISASVRDAMTGATPASFGGTSASIVALKSRIISSVDVQVLLCLWYTTGGVERQRGRGRIIRKKRGKKRIITTYACARVIAVSPSSSSSARPKIPRVWPAVGEETGSLG